MTKKRKETAEKLNVALFIKKQHVDDLQANFAAFQANWIERVALFVSIYCHVIELVKQETVAGGSIVLTRGQTVETKAKKIMVAALLQAGVDKDFIYNNTKLCCNPETVKLFGSVDKAKVLAKLDKRNVDTLEDLKAKIGVASSNKPNNADKLTPFDNTCGLLDRSTFTTEQWDKIIAVATAKRAQSLNGVKMDKNLVSVKKASRKRVQDVGGLLAVQ